MTRYRYRAWLFDGNNEPAQGIEEEILARSKAEAIRVAWRRATKLLAMEEETPCDSCTVRMEYVKQG